MFRPSRGPSSGRYLKHSGKIVHLMRKGDLASYRLSLQVRPLHIIDFKLNIEEPNYKINRLNVTHQLMHFEYNNILV